MTWRDDPATERQLAALRRIRGDDGPPIAADVTKGEASDEIAQHSPKTVDIRAVACPHCSAPPGAPCRRASGRVRDRHHRRRMLLAERSRGEGLKGEG